MTHGTYTAEEIAKYLRVHPYTVKRLARQGKIPGFPPPKADSPLAEKLVTNGGLILRK